MNKFLSSVICSILLVSIFSSVNVLAQVSVGVKEGDWIEYNLSYTGSAPDEYPKWIRIEITKVQGTNITIDLKKEKLDGSSGTNTGTFNLETGFPELLLVPAGLDVGDEFYHEDYGGVTIAGTEEHTYAGAKRTVVHATLDLAAANVHAELHWDQATGILLQSSQSADNFAQEMVGDKTNLWNTQSFLLEPAIPYILIIVIVAIVAIVALFLYWRRQ